MKTTSSYSKLFRGSLLTVLIVVVGASMSCMTTYDSAGRPVQSVDPGAAVAGAAAAGVLGYALANDNDDDYYRGPYYRGRHYHGGYYRRPPHRGYYPRY